MKIKLLSYIVLQSFMSLSVADPISDNPPLPKINCLYHIAPTENISDLALITTWAENAATQTFDLNYNEIDAQTNALKACFTEEGFVGYSDALKKSGNVAAIKSQKLTVSSQKTGQAKIKKQKENEWKVTLPLQVVYQNAKEKFTQLLSVELLITRKVSGDLGIVQLVATPVQK